MSIATEFEQEIIIAQTEHFSEILFELRKDAARHALVIQDLVMWPEKSKFYFIKGERQLSYAHISGHPASQGSTVIVLDGEPASVNLLLARVKPKAPFIVRESSAHVAPMISDYYLEAKHYFEYRMDVTTETFKPAHKGEARQLVETDAPALAHFHGAPPHATSAFIGWIKGARAFHGIFKDDSLLAIGSSMVSLPEVWNLVSIETHRNHRGKGLGTEVTSSLVERALQDAPVVTVTVVSDNLPAVRLYEKLGFQITQDRVWSDCGAGSAP